jgi:hypothetical protein
VLGSRSKTRELSTERPALTALALIIRALAPKILEDLTGVYVIDFCRIARISEEIDELFLPFEHGRDKHRLKETWRDKHRLQAGLVTHF